MIHIGCVHWDSLQPIQNDLHRDCRFHMQKDMDIQSIQENCQLLLYRYRPQYSDELNSLRNLNDCHRLPVIIATNATQEMNQWVSENHIEDCLVISPRLSELMGALDKLIDLVKLEEDTQDAEVKHGRIQKALDYIHDHYFEDIRLNILARMCYMTEITFLRHFKKHMGTTPKAYIKEYRLNFAKELLGNTNLAIQKIASICGYTDASFFIRSFRKAQGMTPSRFRREAQDQQR